jgi:hypothetical protein
MAGQVPQNPAMPRAVAGEINDPDLRERYRAPELAREEVRQQRSGDRITMTV